MCMLNNVSFLKSDFQVTGDDYDKFTENVQSMDDKTHFIKVKCGDIKIWNLYTEFERDTKYVPVYMSTPENTTVGVDDENQVCEKIAENLKKYSIVSSEEKLKPNMATNEELCVMMDDVKISKTVISHNGVMYFTSDDFMYRLAGHVGISGDMLTKPSLERNEFVSYGLKMHASKEITLTYREVNGMKKLMDARSSRYENIPQKCILDIVKMLDNNGMGKEEPRSWQMNHDYTRIYIEFPENKTDLARTYKDYLIDKHEKVDDVLVPGLEITTSDLGQNSFTVRGTWNIDGSVFVHEEVAKKHMGDVSLEDIVDKVKRNIFPEYLEFPARLIKLLEINITDKNKGEGYNASKIRAAVDVASKACEFTKILGRKRERALCESIVEEFDAESSITAYSVALSFLEIPKRLNRTLSDRAMCAKVSASVRNVVFADFTNLSSKEELDNGQLVLKFM